MYFMPTRQAETKLLYEFTDTVLCMELTAERLEDAIEKMNSLDEEDYKEYSFGEFIVEVWSLSTEGDIEINIQAPLSITGLDRDTNQLGELDQAEELLDLISETLVERDIVASPTTQGFYLVDTIDTLSDESYNYYTTHSLTYSDGSE